MTVTERHHEHSDISIDISDSNVRTHSLMFEFEVQINGQNTEKYDNIYVKWTIYGRCF